MPLELQLQKEFVQVVNDHAGFAFKLSNKFIVGVPDLMVKMPGFPATLFEAKQDKLPIKLNRIVVALTPMQWRFLKKAYAAGMTACGVLSFAQNDETFGLRILPIGLFTEPVISVPVESYYTATKFHRKPVMLERLVEYLKLHSKVR